MVVQMVTIVGEPVLGVVMSSVLLLTVAVSAASSTQATILPTARGTLAMAVYGAIRSASRTFIPSTRLRASPPW